MFKNEIEVSEIDEIPQFAIRTPCFRQDREEPYFEQASDTTSKISTPDDHDSSKLTNPSRIWTLTYIRYFFWKKIIMGIYVPESTATSTIGQVPYAYDLLICEGMLFTRKKLPIPLNCSYIFGSDEYNALEFKEIKKFNDDLEAILKAHVSRINLIRNICTYCIIIAFFGLVFMFVAMAKNINNWQAIILLFIIPIIFALFYVQVIKHYLSSLNNKGREYCRLNISKLSHLKINIELGLNCVYINYYK